MKGNNTARTLMIAALAVGMGSFGAPSVAQAQNVNGYGFTVENPDMNDLARVRNGRLRKTDEEFTNEMGDIAFLAGFKQAVFVEMRTGALENGQTPNNRMQLACHPLEMIQLADGTVTFRKDTANAKFITNNRGNEYRNANFPNIFPINGGKNFAVLYNYQERGSNDTKRYAKVIDAQCNPVTIRNANGQVREQVVVMAKNNDDCSMHQTGIGPCDFVSDSGGTTRLACWNGCNGNGRDDAWVSELRFDCTGEGSSADCRITRVFDVSVLAREERSRGRCTVGEDTSFATCCGTEGNSQPQRDGTWCIGVDMSLDGEKGPNANSRILWKEQIDGRSRDPNDGRRLYSVRAMTTPVVTRNPDGTLKKTDMIIFRSGDLYGRNTNNRKGGTYRATKMAVLKATRTGLEYVVPLTDVTPLMLGAEPTHMSPCTAVFGTGDALMPGISFLSGSQNGGGVIDAQVKHIGYDMVNQQFVDLGLTTTGTSYDRHLYSNYLGNNPGNQGRNFAGCRLIPNPYAGMNGNTYQFLQVYAMNGKDPMYVDRPEIKPSSYVSIVPVASIAQEPPPVGGEDVTPPPAGGDDPVDPPGNDDPPSTDEPSDPGSAPGMGCSVSAGGAGSTSGLILILGLALFGIIRRRRA